MYAVGGRFGGGLGYPCTIIEIDKDYCAKIAAEHAMRRSEWIHRALWEVA
jgi:hypothetical protein